MIALAILDHIARGIGWFFLGVIFVWLAYSIACWISATVFMVACWRRGALKEGYSLVWILKRSTWCLLAQALLYDIDRDVLRLADGRTAQWRGVFSWSLPAKVKP